MTWGMSVLKWLLSLSLLITLASCVGNGPQLSVDASVQGAGRPSGSPTGVPINSGNITSSSPGGELSQSPLFKAYLGASSFSGLQSRGNIYQMVSPEVNAGARLAGGRP